MARLNYIEFYYSTKHMPVDKYKCNNENVLRLLKSLNAKGIETAAIDLADTPDPFRQYHKAASGPASEFRSIFGEVRGADYKDYFGKTIPALCCYVKKGDRAPVEVFPRMDKKLGRVYLIEEWLENFSEEIGESKIANPNMGLNVEELLLNKRSAFKNGHNPNNDRTPAKDKDLPSTAEHTPTSSIPLNIKQKRVTFGAVAVLILMFLCPPWYERTQSQMYHEDSSRGLYSSSDRTHGVGLPLFNESFNGYHWLFNAPRGTFDYGEDSGSIRTYKGTSYGYHIAWGILFLQWVFVFIAGLVLVHRYRDNSGLVINPSPLHSVEDRPNPKCTDTYLKDEPIPCTPEENKLFEQGMKYYKLGKYEECADAFRELVRLKPNFAEAWVLLAGANGLIGKFHEAIDASMEAIRLKPDLFQAYINLGGAYCNLGMNHEAIDTAKKALSFKPDVEAYVCLGMAYGNLGLYQESLDAIRQAIRLKPNHADAQFILGTAYGSLGRHLEAIDAFKEAIRLNPYHIGAQECLSISLAYNTYREVSEKEAEAKPSQKEKPGFELSSVTAHAPDIRWKALNDELRSLYSQRQYDRAVLVAKQALEFAEKEFDQHHVGLSLNDLALVYVALGRYAEADPLYKRSMAIFEETEPGQALGTNLDNLANLYYAQGRYEEAEGFYKRSLSLREKALGSDHLDIGHTLQNFANLYYTQRLYEKAEPLFKRSLAIMEKALGPDHPDVAIRLESLALLYQAQGHYALAEPLFKHSLAIMEKAFGPDHPDVATTRKNLAGLYRKTRSCQGS